MMSSVTGGRAPVYDALHDALMRAYQREEFQPTAIRCAPATRIRLTIELLGTFGQSWAFPLNPPPVIAITHPANGRRVLIEDVPALPHDVALLWRSETDTRLVTLE